MLRTWGWFLRQDLRSSARRPRAIPPDMVRFLSLELFLSLKNSLFLSLRLRRLYFIRDENEASSSVSLSDFRFCPYSAKLGRRERETKEVKREKAPVYCQGLHKMYGPDLTVAGAEQLIGLMTDCRCYAFFLLLLFRII